MNKRLLELRMLTHKAQELLSRVDKSRPPDQPLHFSVSEVNTLLQGAKAALAGAAWPLAAKFGRIQASGHRGDIEACREAVADVIASLQTALELERHPDSGKVALSEMDAAGGSSRLQDDSPATKSRSNPYKLVSEQLHSLRARAGEITINAGPGPGNSGINALIGPFNSYLDQTRRLLANDPAALETISHVEPLKPLQERLDASYHRVTKEAILVAVPFLLHALAPYLPAASDRAVSPSDESRLEDQPVRMDAVTMADPRTVFVVYGRNERLRGDLFSFLRALDLSPLEWGHALSLTGSGSPYIGEVLDKAFTRAQAVVVLLTPDDEVRLVQDLCTPDEAPAEKDFQRQARANVLFEAGMAFGRHPDRTILVTIGHVKPFSDVAGRHILRLDNSWDRRDDLATRLQSAGCVVSRVGRDWVRIGDFAVGEDAHPATGQGRGPGGSTVMAPVDEEAIRFLKVVAERDHEASAALVGEHAGMTAQRARYVAEKLKAMGYLDDHLVMGEPTLYSLSSAGRAFLIENGHIR